MRRGEQGPQGTEVGKIQKMGEGSKREPSEYKWHNREMQKGGKGEGDKYRRRRELGRITLRMSEKPTVNHTINYLPIYACIHACMHTHIRMHVLPNAWQWAQTCTITHTKHIYSQHTLKNKNKTIPPPFFPKSEPFPKLSFGWVCGGFTIVPMIRGVFSLDAWRDLDPCFSCQGQRSGRVCCCWQPQKGR